MTFRAPPCVLTLQVLSVMFSPLYTTDNVMTHFKHYGFINKVSVECT